MITENGNMKGDALIELRGSAMRFVLPNGDYYYNRRETVKALLNGELINPISHKPQTMLRSVKGNGENTPLPVQQNEEGGAQ